MVKLIMGLKGSGKTKTLVDLVKKAAEEEHGNVVCIEKDKNLTYDIPYTARLIHAGNYDITHVFIDNFYKMLSDSSDEAVAAFLAWLDDFSTREKVNFTISATADPETVSEGIRKFF